MTTSVLPDEYQSLSADELTRRIVAVKERMGSDLCILGHYYERDEVVALSDRQGDSFALAKTGSETDATNIVFCGVYFMAEASVVLAKPGQRVFIPDVDAGCPLADMADIDQVEAAWAAIESAGMADDIVPITYMNSSAALKAFCGKRGGMVCTSSSAGRAFDSVFSEGKRVFFFPDENLGRNTGHAAGISDEDMTLWNPYEIDDCSDCAALDARVILWKGFCHVHTIFSAEHVREARAKYPGCSVVVHPESLPEVVDISDGNGSTAYLKKYVEDAAPGSTLVIGTEINMVSRLANENPDKKVVPLMRSLCPNMFKISLGKLCHTLENLGEIGEVFVTEDIKENAKKALDRMLAL
jgi:quinolinate synthase